MATQIQFRRGTAAEWTAANPILSDAEVGFETNTKKFKLGDGTTAWNVLAYVATQGIQGLQGDQGVQGIQGEQGVKGDTGADGTGVVDQAVGFIASGGTVSKSLTVTGNATISETPASAAVATTFTAQQTFKEVKDTIYAITDGAGFSIDPANGSVQTITLTAGRTPTAANFEAGQCVLLGIDDGTAYAITWTTVAPTWVSSAGSATAPSLATTGYTWILLWKVGTTMYGGLVGKP